jgi:chromosomal replication initiation ATPase DnaA
LRTADLLSRLRLAPTAAIGPPDDDLMRAVLVKLLIDRQLVVDTGVVGYIALRIERSLDAARSFIDALDREALARQSRISRAIAGDVLLSMGQREEQGPFHDERHRSDNDGDGDRLSMALPLTVRRSGSSGLGGL